MASQCDLAGMQPEDIRIMELIRGVHNPALRTKFLEVKDPKIPDLLKIAANWQHAKDVNKSLETSTKAAKAAKAIS